MNYTAYIGLGSNLASPAGSPVETVRAAIAALSELGTVGSVSSLYRTEPVGYREQPYFVNAVARLATRMEPEHLLQALLEMERRFGRDRRGSVPKGPRTLDLDLLLVFRNRECQDSQESQKSQESQDSVLRDSPALKLPHPEILRRRFVLEPLAEVAPGIRHPKSGKTVCELLNELSRSGAGEEVTRL